MAIRNEFDEYQFALRPRTQRRARDRDAAIKEKVVEGAMTLCGVVGVLLLVYVCMRVMG